MTNYFFYDASGQKIGPVNDQQLRTLVMQGIITPQTPLKTDTGHEGVAEQIPNLFPTPVQQPFQPQATSQYQSASYQPAQPVSGGKATASLILGCIGLLAWIIPLFGVPITIIGVVLGIKGKSKVGTILCVIGLVLSIINAAIGAYQGINASSRNSVQNSAQMQQLESELIKLESDIEVAVTFFNSGAVNGYDFSVYKTPINNQGIYVNSWSELDKYIDTKKREAGQLRDKISNLLRATNNTATTESLSAQASRTQHTSTEMPSNSISSLPKLTDEERQQAEEKRIADERWAEYKRKAEEKRMVDEKQKAENKRIADETRAEEKRVAEEKRIENEKRIAEEKRLADEKLEERLKPDIDRAVDLTDELKKSGFSNLRDTQGRFERLENFVQYGSAQLKTNLEKVQYDFKTTDAVKDRMKTNIRTAQTKIAEKVFVAEYPYSISMPSYSNAKMEIAVGFQSTKLERLSLPVSNVEGKIESSYSDSLQVTLSGNRDRIKELEDSKNEYHAKVWFKNLRLENDYSTYPSADIVKIEIVEKQSQVNSPQPSSKK